MKPFIIDFEVRPGLLRLYYIVELIFVIVIQVFFIQHRLDVDNFSKLRK